MVRNKKQDSQSAKRPEPFPAELLKQPKGARIAYFENQCRIKHTRLEESCRAVLRSVCLPGDDMGYRGRGTMVLVIGPPRVGKTTLIELLVKELLRRSQEKMRQEPGYIPLVSVTTDTDVGKMGSFDWMDFHSAVLTELGDPFISLNKRYLMKGRDVKEAVVEAYLQRKVGVVIIDEAHHLEKARLGRRLQDNVDHLKYFENKTGVNHVLVGTYAMNRLRTINAQLALRTVDVHFSRYDDRKEKDRIAFKSALWAFQRQLPIEEEPQLRQYWEFLYARCLGCIGILKQHLNQALRCALDDEKAKTVTFDHLKLTAPAKDKVLLAMQDILNGEKDLAVPDNADDDLLKKLRKLAPELPELEKNNEREQDNAGKKSNSSSKKQEKESLESRGGQKLRPFERKLGRDPIGLGDESQEQEVQSHEDLVEPDNELQEDKSDKADQKKE